MSMFPTNLPSPAQLELSDAQMVIPPAYITHSLNGQTSAIAAHNTRAALVDTRNNAVTNINVPGIAGKIYTAIGVLIQNKSTLTTLVPTGGLVELTCDAIDWLPQQLIFNTSSAVGANAGAVQSQTWIPIHKPLPAGSNLIIFYTSQNAATDWISVTVFYSTQPYSGAATWSNAALGTSRTAAGTYAADGTVPIPANKGGNCIGFLCQTYAQVTTVLSGGGIVQVHNQAANTAWEPFFFCTGSNTSIGTGGSELPLLKVDAAGDCPGNSSFTFDFITISADTQQNEYVVFWVA